MKKIMMILAVVALCYSCAPPVGSTSSEAPGEIVEATEAPSIAAPTTQPPALKVAIVSAGELGDNGFLDSAAEGLARYKADYGIETLVFEAKNDATRFLEILTSAATEADVIFLVPGYEWIESLNQVVPNFPEKQFVFIDADMGIKDVSSIVYKENEGSFLAGALAALMVTRTDALPNLDGKTVIGVMGGMDAPVIHSFMVGYEQGAKYINPDITIISRFAGEHFNTALGKETSLAMYNDGANIIFQVAAITGLGVFQSAKEVNKYVIGVDADQKSLAPENTLGSMRKRIGDSIYDYLNKFTNGETIKEGVYVYGLSENGVGIDYGNVPPDLVPQDVKDKIEELRQMIIDGQIVVDTYTP